MLSYHGAGDVLICQAFARHEPSPRFSCQHLMNWLRRCMPVVLTLKRWRQEDQEFKFILGYIVSSRQSEKKKKVTSYCILLDLVAPACELSTGKEEAGVLWIWGQPGLYRELNGFQVVLPVMFGSICWSAVGTLSSSRSVLEAEEW